MPNVLAIDQGTTSSRAIVFDETGAIQSVAHREFEQHFPRPGWVEHDAEEIWRSQHEVAAAALARAGIAATDVAGIGITNQRETTVVWDRESGAPVHRAIVWQDRRTAGECERLRGDGLEERIRAATGLVLDPYFSGTKVAWILDQVPGARARAEAGELAFGTIDSWLVWNLTAGARHVTDASNASRTLLFDLHAGDWSDELLSILRVPRAMLPEVCDSSGVVGEVRAPAALAGIPIAGIAGDQQAALFGQACFSAGQSKNTYGTGCFLLANVGAAPVVSRNRLLSTVAWRIGGETTFALEGSVFVGGAVVQWLRDGLGLIAASSEVDGLASSVEDAGGVVLVPAFTGLGAPHWDPHARGTILGLTRGTRAPHLARAALDGIAHQVTDVLEAMAADAGTPITELRVDGGAAASDLLMQLQADLAGCEVLRPAVTETTALGAAYLAGLATGVIGGLDQISAHWRADRRFEPQLDAGRVAALRSRWAEAVRRARGWDAPV